MPDCNAVIVGSGPAGATAAEVLTAAGWSVVVLEKGVNHLLSLDAPFGPLGHVSNDEIKFGRRFFLGPDPMIEPRTLRRDDADGDRQFTGDVNNLPSTVGGGGFHADGKLPRFRAVDFKARSELGPIDGADVVDWPIDYDEMEPYYAQAEKVVGVAGLAGANPFAEWRSGPYPMPPGADMFGAVLSTEAAARLGYHPYPAPTGVNSVEYDGRPACNNCGFCGYYGCPIEAKGDPVAPLRHALETGRCDIRPESYVERIVLDASGRRARGVQYIDRDGNRQVVTADYVVVAGGAFETPRLLLRSEVGNSSGLVGRHLMFHFQTFVVASFPFRLHGHRGRSVTHLHDDHMLVDDDVRAFAKEHGLPYFRAGIVEHGGSGGPVQEATYTPAGRKHAPTMLDSPMRDRLWVFTVQGEDLPQVTNRIDLDPTVRDVHGHPAGRVTYDVHRHEVVASRYYAPKLEAIMMAAGAEHAFTAHSPALDGDRTAAGAPSASRHIMGTCRMGDDPRTSVVDPWQRFHDVENMICTDSSVFPTSTGYGPTLTIVALAIRACRALAGLEPLRSTKP
ncbi:MAG TPA: GMC family oxidoreductase [Acidimicrobiia bacterium]|nr:GMC family oxidoreductase [Acidimicrobiia bacterium]